MQLIIGHTELQLDQPNMGKLALIIVLQMLLLCITGCLCIGLDDSNSTGCVEEERLALLTLKHSFGGPYVHRLWSWQGPDCCGWNGVSCDRSTGRVFKLDVRAPSINESDTEFYGYGWEQLEAEEVNPSLMKLHYLKYLDLSGNDFQFSPIPQFLGQMKGLTYLNLSFATLSGRVPSHLGNLSSLEFLDLGGFNNDLYVEDFMWVSGLSSLQHLDMGDVDLSLTAPKLVEQVLTHLPSLLHLDLSECGLNNNNTHLLTHFSVNSTFLPPTLAYLDLSGNSFYGPISSSLQNITSIEVLDLSFNLLTSSVPLWLGAFNNLKFLHLAHNELNSPQGGIWLVLTNLSNLYSLDLSHNQLGGIIPYSIEKLPLLSSLDLSRNQFSGIIPASLGRLASLISLDLSSNRFRGVIPSSLWRLSSLAELRLSNNKLNGTLSTSLGQLSNLKILDLSDNQLHGAIPKSLGQLINLRELSLDSNALEGVISSEYHLSNLSFLKSLSVGNNNLIELQTEPEWIPPFQLNHIGLSSCKFESRQFPTWLQTQKQLGGLDLSNTSISDTFPLWLLQDNLYLSSLDLSHNQITGPLPPRLVNGTKRLYEFIMADNAMNGSIPYWICNLEIHGTLDLSKNRFLGHIPDCWINHRNFEVIDLSFNKLSGAIPSSFQNLSALGWLLLSNNNLTGPIPHGLSNVSLSALDLGGNRLSGNIPTWIGESFHHLQILNLRNNMFNGIIPPQLCQLSFLQIMDLANNDLQGSLPICLGNLTAMTVEQSLKKFYLQMKNVTMTSSLYEEWSKSNIRQVLKGQELEYTSVLQFLVNMDLSGNRLAGQIPRELSQLLGLVGLNLARNQLSGSIPKNIGDLRALQSLDLSHNQLSGEIPATLSALLSLSYLNLSSNNLEGKIPLGYQLQTLVDPSIYEGNRLCGPPLRQQCPQDNHPYSEDHRNVDMDNDIEKMWFYIVVMVGYALGFWTVCGALLVNKRWRRAYFTYVDGIKKKVYVAIGVKMGAQSRRR